MKIGYENGETQLLNVSDMKWNYVEDPSQEELAAAVNDRNKFMLGYSCKTCKTTSRKLLRCKGCKNVHYCDKKCQRQNWSDHESNCGRKRKALKPNPRYPLNNTKFDLADTQRQL